MKKLIIDLDMGIDDALALLMLLYAERLKQVEIKAIICTNGNTTLNNVVTNVVRLLEMSNRTDIPVLKGASKPFLTPTEPLNYFHGKDGFADLKHEKTPDVSIVKPTPAPIALYDIINENPNEISLLCIGPLTTLALFLMLYPDSDSKLKDVWIMGGNYTAVGNTTAAAEFNFYVDPEAVHVSLENLKCPIFLLPWETCIRSTIPLDWRFKTLSRKIPIFDLLTRAEEEKYTKSSSKCYRPCDAFLSFCFLNPEKHIKTKSLHHALIELHSCHTRGQVVLDHLKRKKPNITLLEEYDQELFIQILTELSEKL